jgi:TonB family protein
MPTEQKQAAPADSGGQPTSAAQEQGALVVLSDTMGVDFGPYLKGVVENVRQNWYTVIPESAKWKKGKVSIEFAITKDGTVSGMRLVGASNDVVLDRAAWGGIAASNPFLPLPSEFTGQYIALRFPSTTTPTPAT